MTTNNRKLIPRRVFREMQNVSTMTQHRREKSLPGYPKPVTISKRVYFFEDEVSRYFAQLRSEAGAALSQGDEA